MLVCPHHCTMSSYREMLLEHIFVGEVLRFLWIRRVHAEVLKPQTDDAGYDLVIDCNGTVRHIQLKASHNLATTAKINVHLRLAQKPSGCVMWLRFDEATLQLGPFLWFGAAPGEPLPSLDGLKVAKHAKANSAGKKTERPHLRQVPVARFTRLDSMEAVVEKLFGLAPGDMRVGSI